MYRQSSISLKWEKASNILETGGKIKRAQCADSEVCNVAKFYF